MTTYTASSTSAVRSAPPKALLLLSAVRAFSFPISAGPVVLAFAAVAPASQWRWGVMLLAAAGVMLLHATGNLLNDYFDFKRGVDRRIAGDEGRPGRLVVRGLLTPQDILAEAMVCCLAAAGAGAVLVWLTRPEVMWFGVIGLAGGYAYTGWPVHLKYRGGGEVLVMLVYGPALMLGAAFAQTGVIAWPLLPLSLLVGAGTTAVLIGNNLRDEDEDRCARIRTLTHIVGPRVMKAAYVACVLAMPIGLAVLAAAGLAPRVLLASPILALMAIGPIRAVVAGQRRPDIDVATAKYDTLVLVAAIAAYALAS